MEWTKENTKDTFIFFKTTKMMNMAIEFYNKLGFEMPSNRIPTNHKGQHVGTVYIVKRDLTKEGPLQIVIDTTWNPTYRNKINPFYKPRRKFPRKMMVSDDKRYWTKRVVLAKCGSLNYPYIAASPPYKPEDEFQIRMRNWKYAKEID